MAEIERIDISSSSGTDSESDGESQNLEKRAKVKQQTSLLALWGRPAGRVAVSTSSEPERQRGSADHGHGSPRQNQRDASEGDQCTSSDSGNEVRSDPRDPANGPNAANLQDGPYQPRDINFPSRQVGGKARSFRPEWFVGRPWFEYSIKLDSAFCFPCRLYAAGHLGCGEPAFTHTGFRYWKNATERFRTMQVCIALQ